MIYDKFSRKSNTVLGEIIFWINWSKFIPGLEFSKLFFNHDFNPPLTVLEAEGVLVYDLEIALCHFHLTVLGKGWIGDFKIFNPNLDAKSN